MPHLLFELGCEELPATFVRRAYEQLEQEIRTRLDEAGLSYGGSRSMGTPRRLIVGIEDVQDRQPDSEKEMRGPAIGNAFDASGAPTKALEGFCRGQGVTVESVRKEGDYVWVTKKMVGQPTLELLKTILPASVRALTFDKTMKWGTSDMRFARPLRWFLAAFGGELVEFDIEGVASGLQSRGHRFMAPDSFEAKDWETLVNGLRQRFVEPDPEVREKAVRDQARDIASGTPELPDALVAENVFLTEWPTALEGSFPADYLELPEPVLVTAMAKHERFFPVRVGTGRLAAKFISIRNGGEEEAVREGNEWVLIARFNDAKFFFDEDRRVSLEEFLERTERMAFQEKLGSIRQRAVRLRDLAGSLAQTANLPSDIVDLAREAARLCKADLATGLVSELPALQGLIGGIYAERDGAHQVVAQAIAKHYEMPDSIDSHSRSEQVAAILLMADMLDKLAGYLGLGLAPSGTSDPFGLRRAASYLIQIGWLWPAAGRAIFGGLGQAYTSYGGQGITLPKSLDEVLSMTSDLFAARYGVLRPDVRHDVLAAALPTEPKGILDPGTLTYRIDCMTAAATDEAWVQAATRPLNILAAAQSKGIAIGPYDEVKLASTEGAQLMRAVQAVTIGGTDAQADLAALKTLAEPIHAYFESTMIMSEDAAQRAARLAVVEAVSNKLSQVGDFRKLVFEG